MIFIIKMGWIMQATDLLNWKMGMNEDAPLWWSLEENSRYVGGNRWRRQLEGCQGGRETLRKFQERLSAFASISFVSGILRNDWNICICSEQLPSNELSALTIYIIQIHPQAYQRVSSRLKIRFVVFHTEFRLMASFTPSPSLPQDIPLH